MCAGFVILNNEQCWARLRGFEVQAWKTKKHAEELQEPAFKISVNKVRQNVFFNFWSVLKSRIIITIAIIKRWNFTLGDSYSTIKVGEQSITDNQLPRWHQKTWCYWFSYKWRWSCMVSTVSISYRWTLKVETCCNKLPANSMFGELVFQHKHKKFICRE